MKKKYIYPPIGYKFADGKGVDIKDEKAILEVCLSLSDDKKFNSEIAKETHKGRLKFLKENGFEVIQEATKNV